jgi:hypothetical protein
VLTATVGQEEEFEIIVNEIGKRRLCAGKWLGAMKEDTVDA